MFIPASRRAIILLLLTLLTAGLIPSALAQTDISLRLSELNIESFPRVSLFAQVTDDRGHRLLGLTSDNFRVLEENAEASDIEVGETTVGSRIVFALNTNIGLRIRDTLGYSRFDLARQALLDWWRRPEFNRVGIDDLSLLAVDGTLQSNNRAAVDLASALDHHQPIFPDEETGYELLFQALDFTADRPPNAGMPNYLVFFTALLKPPQDIPVMNIITRANSNETAIFPVLFGKEDVLEQPEVEILIQIAEETGGHLILFNDDEGLDRLIDLIISQRTQYFLNYTSQIIDSGPHEIRVQLIIDDTEAASAVRNFVLEIQPPEITVLDPPGEIFRSSDDPSTPLEEIQPTSIELEFAKTFADGFPRELTLSQLLVDGVVVYQSEAPPFERLVWDLRPLLQSEEHTIQVFVVDSFGQESASDIHRVQLEVELPPRGLVAIRPALGSLLLALGVLLVGTILAAILLTYGRRPLKTSEVESQGTSVTTHRRTALRRELPDEPAEAFLHPMGPYTTTGESIPLIGTDIFIGSDPSLTAVPLEDPSVDRMHARLIRQVDGGYFLKDQGSIAGTWVNYEEIPIEGVLLSDGDRIHFGRAIFQFIRPNASHRRIIHVCKLETKGQDPLGPEGKINS
ncbi:MAG: FHA domain-containing protein [Anaerolineales bacterium]|nr:FHA domain-containing protein [Anaerolineales bacterium]